MTLVQIRIHLRLESIERLVGLLGDDFIVAILCFLGDAFHQSGVPVVRRELARIPLRVGVPHGGRRRHHVQRHLPFGTSLDEIFAGGRRTRQLGFSVAEFATVHHGRVVRLRNVRRLVRAHRFSQRRQWLLTGILPHGDGDFRRRQVGRPIQIMAVTKYLNNNKNNETN